MLYQNLAQKQNIKILPQQIQFLNILHLTNQELEAKLQNELLENPFLEVDKPIEDTLELKSTEPDDFKDWDEYAYDDVPDYKVETQNYFAEEDAPSMPLADVKDFKEDLKEQLRMKVSDKETILICDYIINSLNDDGMLETSIEDLTDDYSFSSKKFTEEIKFSDALQIVQNLEPLGIAARSSQECLLLQIKAQPKLNILDKKAILLLEKYFHLLKSAQFDKLHEVLEVDDEEFKMVVNHIATFKSKPVVGHSGGVVQKNTVLPDFIVRSENGILLVSLANEYASALRINTDWQESISSQNNLNKEAKQYIKNKLSSAEWYIQAIKQREGTMLRIMKAIVAMQPAYFEHGDANLLKPMVLKNIAENVGVDISTVSRITCNKYVDTPFGMILLKNMFTEGVVNQTGDSISNRVIQMAIADIVKLEDRKQPYTDQQLVAMLNGKGIDVARRTVTKYREHLQIPMSQMRRMWAS